jgi:hypothetical protein
MSPLAQVSPPHRLKLVQKTLALHGVEIDFAAKDKTIVSSIQQVYDIIQATPSTSDQAIADRVFLLSAHPHFK